MICSSSRTDSDLNYPKKGVMAVSPPQLVVGLANGWAGDGKFLLIYPDQVRVSYEALLREGAAPRGFAFWNILDEGRASPQHPLVPVNMAEGLNEFLHIREK